MTSFPDFWTFLETDSPKWWDFTKMRFFSKDLKKCAMDCYAYMLADEKLLNMDGPGKRKYFVAWLMKAPDALVKPQLQQEDKEKKVEWIPLTEEEVRIRDERMKAWKDFVLANPIGNPIAPTSSREIISNGQWEPKKDEIHQNGIDLKLLQLKEAIKKFARRKYKDKYSFSGFNTYKFGLVDVFAESEDDAKVILKKAERYISIRKVF